MARVAFIVTTCHEFEGIKAISATLKAHGHATDCFITSEERDFGRAVLDSDTGVVGLRAGSQGLIIIPPFPVLAGQLLSQWDAAPLLQLLAAEYTIGVVLLRLGRFSVAVYHGQKLVSSKTDARYVKGRHKAGGTSQRRFERIREGQMRRIYDKTCLAVRAQFEPHARPASSSRCRPR